MKNKKLGLGIIFTVFIFWMTGCATFHTVNSNTWIDYEIPPSKINHRDIILQSQLNDGSKFSVFYDKELDSDSSYYYSLLMQDFGWHLNGDKWSGPVLDVRRPEIGKLYLNPRRKVAIYFYPRETYDVFKVEFEDRTNP
jgi:hypothetical protein